MNAAQFADAILDKAFKAVLDAKDAEAVLVNGCLGDSADYRVEARADRNILE